MRQEGTDVNVTLRLFFLDRLCVVNHRNEPVPILPDVEDDVSVHGIGILEHGADFDEMMPSNCVDDRRPGPNFVRRIRVSTDSLAQMPARHDMHSAHLTSQIVKCQLNFRP